MNLPIPTDEEVAQFAIVYDRQFGIRLSREDAREAATRVLRLFYLGTYGLMEIDRKKAAMDAADGSRK